MTNAELWLISKGYFNPSEPIDTDFIAKIMEEYLKDTIDGYVVEAECLDCGSEYLRKLKLTKDGIKDERII